MSYHNSSNSLNLQQHMSGDSNEHVYFSRITQQWEPVWFYATMLKKLSSFAQTIDRSASSSREMVWSHIFSLYNQPNRKCSDMFSPIIDEWCHSQSIDLSAIEIMYTSFLQIYNQYPSLFEDLPPPSQAFPADHPLSYSPDNKSEYKKEDKQKAIKLSNTSLIWGNSFASSIQQFSLLLNWAQLLEKLPPNQKEAIWNTCQFFPYFEEAFDRSSFRKTFLKWAGNLPAHLSHITILFAAIGFLRDKGIIKHQFFYPNSTIPVFNNGMKAHTPPPTSQCYPSSPQHYSPSSAPMSPTSPIRMSSPIPSSANSSRSSSPAPSVHDYSPAGHHFYSSPNSSVEAPRKKSLPFESLSLPPLSLPSPAKTAPPTTTVPPPTTTSSSSSSSSSPSPAPGTTSSRLGLLALAAFQADDPEHPLPLPPLSSTLSTTLKKETDNNVLIPPPKEDGERGKESKEKAPAHMKISKRKNSCSEWGDEEAKRPRTMNLSHILCS